MSDPWEYRFLSVKEPWASAIVDGHKDIENRGHGFSIKYRGRLWIQASKEWSTRGAHDARMTMTYGHFATPLVPGPPFVSGFVIGHVEVVDIHRASAIVGDELICDCDSQWAERRYELADGTMVHPVTHLVLADPVRIPEPIPAAGALGLWRPRHGAHDDLVAELQARRA